jgi:hypothetical protein
LALDHFTENGDARRYPDRVCFDRHIFLATWTFPAPALTAHPSEQQQPAFTSGELVGAGQQFFGTVSRGLASLIEKAVGQWGLPNGYVLGEEAGGAFFGGLRYGEGTLYTKNAGDLKVFWQQGNRVNDLGAIGTVARPAQDAWHELR